MVKALFDTNILVDYLNAVPQARAEFQRYTEKAISRRTRCSSSRATPKIFRTTIPASARHTGCRKAHLAQKHAARLPSRAHP